jgi:peptide-methionine (S)-S-oxide reductase
MMNNLFGHRIAILVIAAAVMGFSAYGLAGKNAQTVQLPDPAVDAPLAKTSGRQTAVLAGGCFWGVQLVYQHVKGVTSATSGYSGGSANNADYKLVSSGTTGHAESVKITYDPSQISYGQLLKIYFSVAHDPTQLNRQGPDTGTQYRSAIFYTDAEQQKIAQSYINQLQSAKVYSQPIVTKVVPLSAFYPAEGYHQDYATLHPHEPYIMFNDLPKLANFKATFPGLYQTKEASSN